jgi:hypothetical protein
MNSLKDVLFFLESKNLESVDAIDLDKVEVDAPALVDTEEESKSDSPWEFVLTYLQNLITEEDKLKCFTHLAEVLSGTCEDLAVWEATVNGNNVQLYHGVRYADFISGFENSSNDDINHIVHNEEFATEVPGVFDFYLNTQVDFSNLNPTTHASKDELVASAVQSIAEPEVPQEDNEEQIKVYIADLQNIVDTSEDEALKARLQEIILNLQKFTAISSEI